MDHIETEFLSRHIDDLQDKLDDEYFVNWINKSPDQLKSCLGLIRSIRKCETNEELQKYLKLAVCSLQVFVLANWVYVKKLELDNEIVNLLNEIDQKDLKNELQLFDSDYQPPVRYLQLLYLTKQILHSFTADELGLIVWKLRYLTVFQSILNRQDNSFDHEHLAMCLLKHLQSNELDQRLKMRLLIELCQHNLSQNKVQDVKELLVSANNCSQLEIMLSGALGKRTHFQQEAKSILFLSLTRKSIEPVLDKMNKEQIDGPRDMKLNDDTLLNKPLFESTNGMNSLIELSDDEETLLLAMVKFGSKCGIDELLKEELLAYLDTLINHSTVWLVQFESMYQRSIFEKSERRKVERSMLQLNELVDKINGNTLANGITKLYLFYSCQMTPVWRIKRKLADVLVSLSCVKEALDIYLELDLWEEIVFCYKQIKRRDKAAEVIRQQLTIKQTPYLYCLLGDATDEIEHYERAWQLSDHKSYLAQKRLGYHYFNLNDYHKAIECFKKSVEINSNQFDSLQRLGYSALLVEDYELAACAYRRVVECDLDNFQAWNNLSKAYIKLNDKQRAYRTLQEALKNNYENWKIWENYIVVCVDVGAFNEVINAWNRLIDLKSKYEDDEIMTILVEQLCQTDTIANQLYLQKRTLELLGRMTANFQCSSKLWILYARLLIHLNESDEKVLNCLSKGQRSLMSKPGWEKSGDSVLHNLKSLNQLYTYHNQVLQGVDDVEMRKRYWASFKLSSNSILSLIESRNEYWSTDEVTKQTVQNYLNDFASKLNDL